LEYEWDGDALLYLKEISEYKLMLKGSVIRQERTGVHARLNIMINGTTLAWTNCNIERSEERVKLTNAAFAQFGESLATAYPKEYLRHDLDTFCIGLWDEYSTRYLPELMDGDADMMPLQFLLEPYVLVGGGTILFAPPGRGKSLTGLLWFVSIDAGISKFWDVGMAPGLYINLERSRQSMRRRLAAVNRALGLPANRKILMLNARGRSLSEVYPSCQKAIAEHQVCFIVLDSMSRSGYGDLTENKPGNALIDSLSGLCDTWLALGHTPRQDETHIFGSLMFDAGADITIKLLSESKEDGRLGVGWQITKANDLRRYPVKIYAFEFDDDSGLKAVRPAETFEFPKITANQEVSVEEQMIDYILEQDSADATATELADALKKQRTYIARLLRSSRLFVKTRTEKRSQYYGVKASIK